MAYYNTCPFCGAHLDPDEKCDCKEREEKNLKSAEEISYEEKDGQLHFDMSA